MKLIAKLIPAPNYRIYAGADISGFVDTSGKIFWACTAFLPSGSQATVMFIQQANKPTEAVIPINDKGLPLINARGEFNGVANGKIYLTAWDKTDEKNPAAYMYEINEAQVSPQTPISVPSTVDQVARDAANNALQKATAATAQIAHVNEIANAAHTTADVALSKANAVNSLTIDTVWSKINDRLFLLANAIEANDRSDPLNGRFLDVLFKKTNDWIYGQLKDRGLIK